MALSYSSGAANGELEAASEASSNDRPSQSGDYGLGWSLRGVGAITRSRDGARYLSLPGGSYRLDHVEGDEWRTIPESFLYIEHDGGEIGIGGANLDGCNPAKWIPMKAWGMHPWTVRTPDGWEYQFGGEATEQYPDILGKLPKAGETAASWRGNVGCWGGSQRNSRPIVGIWSR